jgi:hypothetical protein
MRTERTTLSVTPMVTSERHRVSILSPLRTAQQLASGNDCYLVVASTGAIVFVTGGALNLFSICLKDQGCVSHSDQADAELARPPTRADGGRRLAFDIGGDVVDGVGASLKKEATKASL